MIAKSSTTPGGLESGALAVIVIIYVAVFILFLIGWVKILSKAGYSGWWVLIGLVPLVNLVMLLVFAFSDWPVLQEVRRLRSGAPYAGYSGPTEGPLSRPYLRPPPPPPRTP
jgi:uncharacterized membrane protein YhaH (DUF805 family)